MFFSKATFFRFPVFFKNLSDFMYGFKCETVSMRHDQFEFSNNYCGYR